MKTQKNTNRMRQLVTGAFIASVASAGVYAAPAASTVQLPGINEMSAELYGDFYVYSLDLLAQCSSAGDARCLPSGPYPVQSAPGQISSALLVYQGGAQADNYDSSGPLNKNAPAGDNPFAPPSGAGTTTYQFSAANEPSPPLDRPGTNNDLADFVGDQPGTWEVQLGALASYLGYGSANPSNLVFIFDNNQTGTTAGQWLYLWASAAILDTTGTLVSGQCYQVFSNGAGGNSCTSPTDLVAPTFDAGNAITNPFATSYVAVVGDFCVNKVTGASYNIGLAQNAGACGSEGYYISNNLGQSTAEFVAYSMELEQFILANYEANPEWVLSVNARFANLNNGNEQLWIAAANVPSTVPEPGSLALVGMGFVGMVLLSRRRFSPKPC